MRGPGREAAVVFRIVRPLQQSRRTAINRSVFAEGHLSARRFGGIAHSRRTQRRRKVSARGRRGSAAEATARCPGACSGPDLVLFGNRPSRATHGSADRRGHGYDFRRGVDLSRRHLCVPFGAKGYRPAQPERRPVCRSYRRRVGSNLGATNLTVSVRKFAEQVRRTNAKANRPKWL